MKNSSMMKPAISRPKKVEDSSLNLQSQRFDKRNIKKADNLFMLKEQNTFGSQVEKRDSLILPETLFKGQKLPLGKDKSIKHTKTDNFMVRSIKKMKRIGNLAKNNFVSYRTRLNGSITKIAKATRLMLQRGVQTPIANAIKKLSAFKDGVVKLFKGHKARHKRRKRIEITTPRERPRVMLHGLHVQSPEEHEKEVKIFRKMRAHKTSKGLRQLLGSTYSYDKRFVTFAPPMALDVRKFPPHRIAVQMVQKDQQDARPTRIINNKLINLHKVLSYVDTAEQRKKKNICCCNIF